MYPVQTKSTIVGFAKRKTIVPVSPRGRTDAGGRLDSFTGRRLRASSPRVQKNARTKPRLRQRAGLASVHLGALDASNIPC